MSDKKTYATMSRDLEEILESLQNSSTDIDEAIKLHERGQKLIADMQTYLKQAENKVRKLTPKSGA